MNLSPRHILRSLLPAPRKPASWRSALPLAIFLAAYAVLLLCLDLFDVVLFTRRWAFAVLVVTPWVWWMYLANGGGLTPGRALTSLMVRLAIVGLLAGVLAEPRAVRKSETLSIVYVVDASDSLALERPEREADPGSNKPRNAALAYVVNTARGKPEKDEIGVVVFGGTAAVELPPRQSFPLESDTAIGSRVQRDATNLAKALSLAAAIVPEDSQARVVLISDGVSTAGNLGPVLDDLKSRRIPVDVLPVSYAYDKEVWLERIELPRIVKEGESYEATIILSSLQAGAGKLTVQENGAIIFEGGVKFERGKNRYVVPFKLRGPGYYEYLATVEVPRGEDHWDRNNRAIGTLNLRGEGRVLLVTDPAGDVRDWQPLEQALKDGGQIVEVKQAYDVPRDMLALLDYDCIIFNNVAQAEFDAGQLQAVHDAVKDLGAGFLMVGGGNSFGPGGYHRTIIEDALPVDMDVSQKKVLPKAALVIVLHTCEFAAGNTWGKNITKAAIRVLGAQDEAGVLFYDWSGVGAGERWLFKLTPASEYDRLVPLINNANIGDMPSLHNIMQMGLAELQKSDASAKHMIVITDGDPGPPTPPLIQGFIDSKVSVSTVAVFPHGGADISKLQLISNMTGGRYYFPQDPNKLPEIFIKEATTLKRSLIQNKDFVPKVSFPSPILKGIEGFPALHGYVLVTPKPRANVVLRTPLEEDIEPVLAVWRYGTGKTAAWTSDLGMNWARDWQAWGQYRAFVKQLMTDIARTERQSNLRMSTYADGDKGVIHVEDYAEQQAMLQVQARVENPDGGEQTVTLRQTAPRRYEGEFPISAEGRYQVLAAGAAGSRTDQTYGTLILPYSQEYLRFRANPQVMEQIRERTGGRGLTGEETGEELFRVDREVKQNSKPIMDWVLILLACLIPLDVGLRRVQIDWQPIKAYFNLSRRREVSGAAMAKLRDVKKRAQDAIAERGKAEPAAGATATAVSPSAGRPTLRPKERPLPTAIADADPVRVDSPGIRPKQPRPAAPGEPAPVASTTERLLRAKRRVGGEAGEGETPPENKT